MVWYLFEAEKSLNTGAFARAEEMLAAASGELPTAVTLEVAEYWHLKGREKLSRLSQGEACEAFEKAMAAEPGHPKYLAAWAETKFSMGFSEDGPNDFGDILSRLTSSEPAVLSIKVRILAAEKRFDEAEQILATFSGVEQLSALAIIYTMRSKSAEALAVCEAGLSLANLKDGRGFCL
jgi:tetratricopeptide (TPR) repeat protein